MVDWLVTLKLLSELLSSALISDTVEWEEELSWLWCRGEPLLTGGSITVTFMTGGATDSVSVSAFSSGSSSGTGEGGSGDSTGEVSVRGPSTQSSVCHSQSSGGLHISETFTN